jgi:hypothetical protein
MIRFFCAFPTRWTRLLHAETPIPTPTIGQLIAGLSILSAIGLGFLYGAAVMYYQLPPYDFLDKCFTGARAWQERGQSTIPVLSPEMAKVAKQEGITVDKAEKTFDGFTLYTMSDGSRATLLDMRGNVVHRWELPFSQAGLDLPYVANPLADEQIHWFRCHLYPNGDLLAIYHADGDTPFGYGLIKLDKDSKLIWAYANNVHHDLDVGEDGTIYTLTQKIVSEPSPGLEFVPSPYISDSLVVLSPEGRELENIPIPEAFVNSPYALVLNSDTSLLDVGNSSGPNAASPQDPSRPHPFAGYPKGPIAKGDLLHTNSVKVLSQTLAAKFPLFQAGQVLLSLRNRHTLAVLDRPTRRVIWASQGLWRRQHDAEFLDNGHLLLYDNTGLLRQTRILEYDPLTQAVPWAYTNEDSTPFSAFWCGMKQRLPNGNTLIVDPGDRRLFEVTQDKKLVWENYCPLSPTPPGQLPRSHGVRCARRYSADELTFLKDVARPRP